MKRAKNLFKSPRRLPALLFALIFAGLGVYVIGFSRAATVVTLSLNPSTSTVSQGSNFTVTVVENSSTTPVFAVSASLTYDQTKLQFVSSDASTSGFTTEAENTGGNGVITLSRGKTGTALSGTQTVSVLTFKALTTGSAAINFNAICTSTAQSGCSSVVDGNNTQLLTGITGGTYTINDTTAPTAPTGLAASGTTATSTTLNWTASTDNVGVTGYNIYRNGTKIATATATTYTNTGLTPSTAYSYTVQAYDAANNLSAQTVALNVTTTADTTAPTLPTGLTSSGVTGTSLTLNWTASTDNVAVTGYNIYRNGTKIATSTTNSYTNTGLTSGTTYSYTVQAYDAAGNTSAQTAALNVTTTADTSAPTVPTNLAVTSKTNTSVNLSWTASTDNVAVTGYNVYRNGTKVGTVAGTTYSDSGLTPGTTYSYTVLAFDAAGNNSAQTAALQVALSIKSGDINADNVVDINDLSILAANFNRTSATRSQGDLNGDGVVNIYDLGILCSGWGL